MKSQEIFDKITNEEIEQYYNEQNHTQQECADHFNISLGLFMKLLNERGIKKDPIKHQELIKKSKLEKYGNANYNNREKSKETCLKKYGVDNPFKDTEKIKQSYIEKLGVEHPMKDKSIAHKVTSKINYEESIKKGKETYFEKTGYDNPGKNPECIKKMLETKIKNGVYDSPHTSWLEDRLEKLLRRKFPTVIKQYRDSRYARESGYEFECDFYIPEEDLFIELNAHPTHYIHPFNKEDKNDVALMEKLSKSDKQWDKATLETWTIRDVEKLNIAKTNNLNYLLLYPSDSIHNNKKINDTKYSSLIEYLIKKLNKKE